MKSYLLLGISIVFELLGTSFMKMSDGYSRLFPTVCVFICYGIAFYVLATIMDTLPLNVTYATWSLLVLPFQPSVTLNVTYATWSGVGLVATAIIGVTVFGEIMNIYNRYYIDPCRGTCFEFIGKYGPLK